MTDIGVVLLALFVVVLAVTPFLAAWALAARGARGTRLDVELARLLRAPPSRGRDSS